MNWRITYAIDVVNGAKTLRDVREVYRTRPSAFSRWYQRYYLPVKNLKGALQKGQATDYGKAFLIGAQEKLEDLGFLLDCLKNLKQLWGNAYDSDNYDLADIYINKADKYEKQFWQSGDNFLTRQMPAWKETVTRLTGLYNFDEPDSSRAQFEIAWNETVELYSKTFLANEGKQVIGALILGNIGGF